MHKFSLGFDVLNESCKKSCFFTEKDRWECTESKTRGNDLNMGTQIKLVFKMIIHIMIHLNENDSFLYLNKSQTEIIKLHSVSNVEQIPFYHPVISFCENESKKCLKISK